MTSAPVLDDVLVLAPAVIEAYYGAGNWKDVRGVNLLISALSRRARFATFDHENPENLAASLQPTTRHVIVHYSLWPAVLTRLRQLSATARLHVRVHNAEALQHWQRMVHGDSRPSYARIVRGVARLLLQDVAVKRKANTILGISEWDNQHYWRRLPSHVPVLDFPYVSPWPELRPQIRPLPWGSRRAVVLTMPGGSDAIGLASQRNFKWLADAFGSAGARWEFVLSPGFPGFDDVARAKPAPPLQPWVGLFEPWDALCSVRAVAVLTPFGFGTKTTIFDAIAAGCHVLVDARLAERFPAALRARFIPLRSGEAIDVAALEERLNSPPDFGDVPAAIRARALDALRTALD